MTSTTRWVFRRLSRAKPCPRLTCPASLSGTRVAGGARHQRVAEGREGTLGLVGLVEDHLDLVLAPAELGDLVLAVQVAQGLAHLGRRHAGADGAIDVEAHPREGDAVGQAVGDVDGAGNGGEPLLDLGGDRAQLRVVVPEDAHDDRMGDRRAVGELLHRDADADEVGERSPEARRHRARVLPFPQPDEDVRDVAPADTGPCAR